IDGWGRPGDLAVVAEERGRPVGAAWVRLFPADRPGFGFVGERIPELSIADEPDHRRRGLGLALLTALIQEALSAGFPAISLSVERDNPALHLYERCGFRIISSPPGTFTMVLRLQRPPSGHGPL